MIPDKYRESGVPKMNDLLEIEGEEGDLCYVQEVSSAYRFTDGSWMLFGMPVTLVMGESLEQGAEAFMSQDHKIWRKRENWPPPRWPRNPPLSHHSSCQTALGRSCDCAVLEDREASMALEQAKAIVQAERDKHHFTCDSLRGGNLPCNCKGGGVA